MDWPFINQLSRGDEVKGVFLVASKQLNTFSSADKQGRYYLSLTLKDSTGLIQARIWNGVEEIKVEVGEIVKVEGSVSEYRGSLQLNINHLEKMPEQEVDLFRFLPKTSKDISLLIHEINEKVKEVANPYLAKLLTMVFGPTSSLKHKFYLAPAGKTIHHAYAGGLLEHSLEVTDLCRLLAKCNPSKIDQDLLLTGALLHDLGKIEEYNIYNASFTQTDHGLLKGHIILGLELIREIISYINDFPDRLKLLLEHMIIAHHGRQEWGSPVEPKTIEAVTLHYADLMSCHVNHALGIMDNHSDQDAAWSKWDRVLNSSLYLGEYLNNLKKLEVI
jgi:3'-5' exoribonuclease